MIRSLMLCLGLLGTVLFGGAFVVSYTHPILVEQAAREVVRIEVERRVAAKLDGLDSSRILAFAQKALGRTDAQIEATRRAIRDEVSVRAAKVVADMLDANCECRRRLAEAAREADANQLSTLQEAKARLAGLIESAYASVSTSLLREFRIFTGSNALAFGLLALVAFVRKQAGLQLLLPATALVGAIALVGGLYLFNQDWLHTIVFGDYLGWGYAAWLSVVSLLFADILMNRARVTTQLVNAVGGAATAVPC